VSTRLATTSYVVAASACCVVSSVAAAERVETKRSYNLPRGDAAITLRQFASSSGRQVFFMMDKVRGEHTNALSGEFSPREAIERMLAGTALVAHEDEATGGFMVTRRSPPAQREEVGNGSKPVPQPKPDRMTSTKPPTLLQQTLLKLHAAAIATAALLASPPEAGAQNATGSGAADNKPDEAVVLTPFEVRTDKDQGFVASTSLSGGRLATDLKDSGIALSVVTRDLIDALGIQDLTEAMTWSPNSIYNITEGGANGDQSGTPIQVTVRGVTIGGGGTGRQQRNYFPYFAPMDSYSTERYDLGRGPNAVLFGNSTMGGLSSTMTKQARFGRPFLQFEERYGSWNYTRTTADVNRPLNDQFAVRAAGVYFRREGWRDKEFERTRAAFLTGTYKFNKDTSVRVEGEYGESARNIPFANITDQFSGWDGVSTFAGRLDTLPTNANAIGVSRRAAGYLVFDPFSATKAIMNYQNDPITLSGGATSVTPIGDFVQGSLPSFNVSGAPILHQYDMPANRFARAIAGSKFRPFSDNFSMSSDVPILSQRYKDLQATFDRAFGRNLFLEAAVDINRTRQLATTENARGLNTIYIDINQRLPDGSNNPHLLEPYADSTLRKNPWERDAWGARMALGYLKDLGRWGNYRFSTLAGYTDTHDRAPGVYALSIAQNPDHRRWGASGSGLTATDLVKIRRYMYQTSRPFLAPQHVRYIDPLTGVDKEVNTIWALENDRSDSYQDTHNQFKYLLASVQAKYWKNRLVVTGATRFDKSSSLVIQQASGGDYSPTDWDGVTPLLKPNAPADYATLTYIPKDASGKPLGAAKPAETRPRDGNGNRLPQYANDRFKDDYNAPEQRFNKQTHSVGAVVHVLPWLSPYFNYAETFNPPNPIQRIDSSFLPPSFARGTDIGIRMNFLQDRVVLNVLHYSSRLTNNESGSAIGGNVNTLISARPRVSLDPTNSGRNIRGEPNVPGTLRDINDSVAYGNELELTANFTRSWRMIFNVGLPTTYTENGNQDAKKYLATHMDTLTQIAQDAGAKIDPTTGFASADPSIDPNDLSLDITSVVNAYNGIVNSAKNFPTARPSAKRGTPNFNLYTDYTFREGRLRGFKAGAGVQYRAKKIIGSRGSDTIVDPNNPSRAIDDPTVDSYTDVRQPWADVNVVLNLGYSLRLKNRNEVGCNLRINNLLNDHRPYYTGTALRPRNNDFTSPARETVPGNFAFKDPISFQFSVSYKM
jgi:outer membrane receptor protein involved in Fe transport